MRHLEREREREVSHNLDGGCSDLFRYPILGDGRRQPCHSEKMLMLRMKRDARVHECCEFHRV